MSSSVDYSEVLEILDEIVKSKLKQITIKENFQKREEYKCLCSDIEPTLHDVDGSMICSECGLVLISRVISTEREWRDFSSEENSVSMNRCGGLYNPLLPHSSLSTTIAKSGKFQRLQNLHKWSSIPYEEKVIIDLQRKMEVIAEGKGIPKYIVTKALMLFKKINTVHRGPVRDGLIAACFYYACKSGQCNIQTNDIVKEFNIDMRGFSKACKMYVEEFNDNVDKSSAMPADFVIRFAASLRLPPKIEKLCVKVIKACSDLMLLKNYSPQSVTSGIIYFVVTELDLKITKTEISKQGDTSKDRITSIYKILKENKVEIFNRIKYGKTK